MARKTKGAFGKPKWQRAKDPKEVDISYDMMKISKDAKFTKNFDIPSEKKSWWHKIGHKIWGRT